MTELSKTLNLVPDMWIGNVEVQLVQMKSDSSSNQILEEPIKNVQRKGLPVAGHLDWQCDIFSWSGGTGIFQQLCQVDFYF